MMDTLYYVHDPMCSWCYAYAPLWKTLESQLPEQLQVQYVLGGLAADSDEPMPLEMQQKLQNVWRHIENQVPNTRFNDQFWQQCEPRRSTWRSCRAALLAREQGLEAQMITTIQQAYYQHAKNPSNRDTLIDCAKNIGIATEAFANALDSDETKQRLVAELNFAQSIGGNSFPSLILHNKRDRTLHLLPIDYLNLQNTLNLIIQKLELPS